ncbi:hypothetical protein IGI04_029938 [Brassica rapa subsp. trilocularis]|uniref:Uncharacterized protein n=1 Tax=Brassica rapa subsp. trilocularis TaxID=1813537 RepID=A0ABQ7LPA1_BRACM|nr:hypothetical protein IGI04_029938 [Brassica rapa subsp. trilocularis]
MTGGRKKEEDSRCGGGDRGGGDGILGSDGYEHAYVLPCAARELATTMYQDLATG